MIYSTSGGFIQSLKDYDKKQAKAKQLKEKYQNLHYERYEKIRSPLDYDIVKYKKKKDGTMEAIRQIKSGGSYNESVVRDLQEQLDKEMDEVQNEYSKLIVEMENTREDLKAIKNPLKKILIMRYLEHKKLKEVCKASDLYLDESGMHKYIARELKKYYEQ